MNFSDRPVVVIASGASLTNDDVEVVRKLRHEERIYTIGINDNWRFPIYLDVLYACDKEWWRRYGQEVWTRIPKKACWSVDTYAKKIGINYIDTVYSSFLSTNPANISYGSSSGFQVLNLLRHWQAKEIYLCGYDCKPINGKNHWFGQHPNGLGQHQPFERWIKEYNQIAKDLEYEGIKVLNCSHHSALDCWEKVDIRSLYDSTTVGQLLQCGPGINCPKMGASLCPRCIELGASRNDTYRTPPIAG